MKNNNLTGYPSIDRPWLKYYSKEAIESQVTESSIYEYLLENNRDNLKNTALVYMGRKISYQSLFESIENVAKAFAKLGLGRGDVVACIAPSFPEIIYSFYAANKLGAVSDYFDPRTEPQVVYEELKQVKPKLFMIFEDFLPKFREMIDRLNSAHVLVVSAKDSLPFPLKTLAGMKKKVVPKQYQRFAEILKGVAAKPAVATVTGITHEVAMMEHTGGTTGTPKAVCLTNQNVNAVVQQYKMGSQAHSSKESWLAVGFPFTAYAIIASQHLPLVLGMRLFLCFTADAAEIAKIVMKHRINHMANTPLVWENMILDKRAVKTDFSFLIDPTVGADTLSVEKEKEINAFLKEHHCDSDICKGYGMTELASGVSTTVSSLYNKIGSVGIPFTHTVVSVFDTETGEELTYGEQGEICISGPSVMKCYYNNLEETGKVLKKHKDGRIWMHSGDIGHIDEDGFLFIDGRIKRMIINHHGFKIFAPQLEKVILQHPGIDKCCVVGAPDTEYQTGQVAVAFLVFKEGCTVSEEELQKLCADNLPEYYLVSRCVFVKEFPYTSASKVDYRKLEEMAEKTNE